MSELARFGVAMERELLERFDERISEQGYRTRSEALRDLVRRELDRASWDEGEQVFAAITLVYDHHVRELSETLNRIQHDAGPMIISTLHVHIDHHHCMEVIAARGPALELRQVADRLLGTKGVVSGDVVAARPPNGVPKQR